MVIAVIIARGTKDTGIHRHGGRRIKVLKFRDVVKRVESHELLFRAFGHGTCVTYSLSASWQSDTEIPRYSSFRRRGSTCTTGSPPLRTSRRNPRRRYSYHRHHHLWQHTQRSNALTLYKSLLISPSLSSLICKDVCYLLVSTSILLQHHV
jgi:hypothetical protein